jgi:hypothetical protein
VRSPLAIVGALTHIGHEQKVLYIGHSEELFKDYLVSAFIDTNNNKWLEWEKNSFFNLLFHGKNKYIHI